MRAGGCDPQLAVGSDIKPADSESRLGPEFRVRGGGKTRLVATCGGDGVWVYNVCVSSRGREMRVGGCFFFFFFFNVLYGKSLARK